MYQNVSDEAISASDSASFIIAQMVAFGIEAENAEHIINAVNETANSFAVSSGQLANSLGIVSSTAAAMGNSLESTIGMMTAITEQTRNSSKAARGLNTIFNNLAQVLDDASSNGKKIAAIFDDLGVSMYDMDGQLLSSYELLTNLSEKWDGLDTNTKNYIASTIAGTNQLNNFLALMNNFDHAIEATNTALNSAGSAATENARYMESLNAKTNQLRATFQELANRVIDSELVGALLGLANAFLQLLNNPIGAFVVQVTLLTTALYGFIKLMQAMQIVDKVSGSIKSLIGIIPTLIASFTGATTASYGLSSGLTAVNIASGGIGIALIALASILGGELIGSLTDVSNSTENLTQNFDEQIKSSNDLVENIQNLREQYESLVKSEEKSIDKQIELAKLQSQLNEAFGNTGTKIDLLNGSYEYNNELIKENLKLQLQTNILSNFQENGISNITKQLSFDSELSQEQINDLKSFAENTGIAFKSFLQESSDSSYDLWNTLVSAVGLGGNGIGDLRVLEQAFAITANDALKLQEFLVSVLASDLPEDVKNGIQDSINLILDEFSIAEEQTLEFQNSLMQLYELLGENEWLDWVKSVGIPDDIINSVLQTTIATEQLNQTVSKSPQTVDNMVNAYNALSDALDSYNQYGGLLEDNINNLNTYLPGLVDHLYNEDGALTSVGASALSSAQSLIEFAKALYTLQKASAVETLEAANKVFWETGELADYGAVQAARGDIAAAQQILNMLNSMNFAEASATGGGGGGGTQTDTVLEAHKSLVELLESELQLLEDQGASEEERIAKIKEIQDALHAQAEYLRSIGAEQAEINALSSEWWSYQRQIVDILEEQADKYEIAIDYMTGLIDDEISALEEQKAAIQAQNDELNEQIQLEEALDALAKARQKKTLVYKDGRFQYVEDIDEVSSAQENLDQIRQEQALQDRLDAIDEEIDAWEKYKEEWQNVVDSYTDNQNRLIAEEILGTNLENVNWQNRLSNLQVFAAQYAALMAQIANASAGGMGGGAGPGTATLPDGSVVSVDIVNGKTQNTLPVGSIVHTQGGSYQITGGTAGNYTSEKVNAYATGTLNSRPGMSLVGENGPELRIMDEGSGIIPAQITKNLWQWGALNPNSVLSNKFSNQNKSFAVTIQNLNLPNVKDGMEFVNYMKNNFWRKTMQFQLS